MFLENGGLPFYAAWALNSEEPAMNPIKNPYLQARYPYDHYNEYYLEHQKTHSPVARALQARLVLLRTNLWDYNCLQGQLFALANTFRVFL